MYTNAQAMALFNKATSLARKFQTFGEPSAAVALSAIDTALIAIADSDMSDATKAQLTAELQEYIAQINTEQGKPEVAASQDPGIPSQESTIPSTPPLTEPPTPDNNEIPTTVFPSTTAVSENPSPFDNTNVAGAVMTTRSMATTGDQYNTKLQTDWRVRLSLGPDSDYLYKSSTPGILAPLSYTNGVIFPYTPNIQVQYTANYDATDVVHNNYKFYQYKNSAVDSITITCDFTAQTTSEANYILAVIHFFRSVTKMFYGKDQNPVRGTPPPLCYLSGLGQYQFNDHPLVISNFSYNLPTDVDYIRARVDSNASAGVSRAGNNVKRSGSSATAARLTGMVPGANAEPPQWIGDPTISGTTEPTYVPTKIQLSIQAYPVVSRSDISNEFSLAEYATGQLLKGGHRLSGGFGGIW